MTDHDLPAPLATLETKLAGDATRAFAADVIDAAARLEVTSPAFQRVLSIVKDAGTRLRDWRAAVKVRHDQLAAERARLERQHQTAQRTPEQVAIDEVRADLLFDEDGFPRRNLANISTILSRDPRWQGRLAYHALRERVVITEPIPWHPDDAPAILGTGDWTDQDSTRAAAWLAREWDIDTPSAPVNEVIEALARKRVIDPIADYLGALRHDDVPRLDTWLSTYLGVPDSPYACAVGARWMISAVARAFTPGCKVDCVLILEGSQGIGKSSALRALCADPSWFFDDELAIGDKDAAQSITGKWIIELGELSALSRGELAAVKGFITRQADTYRPSFGRRAHDFPRRCVFAGSTNEETYLRDEENRRFWPVRCGQIDLAALVGDRDQLWAEATRRFLRGEPWYVDSPDLAALCRAEQDERVQPDPWNETIGAWLEQQLAKPCEAKLLADRCPCVRCKGVTVARILTDALKIECGRQTRADEMRAGAILRHAGWKRGKLARRDGGRTYPYYPLPAPT